MRMPAAVTQFRWDYVMESGIVGTTPALALTLAGDYLPWGPGGDGRVQVYGGLAPAQSCTPLFP